MSGWSLSASHRVAPASTDSATPVNSGWSLTQQSNYQSAVDRWRDTQSMGRWASTGASVKSPQSQQEVDKLLANLRNDQRVLKKQLGFDHG